MAKTLKLGLVGASASGDGWGPAAHIPAQRGIEQIELAALCTSRPESAVAAAKAYGVDRAYHDVHELVAQPDIDIIAAVVRIPNHRDVVMAALAADKHVYCEWPLGADLAETREMATLARGEELVAAIGLQGRVDPTLTYIRELCEQGWLGDVLSIDMTMYTGGALERPSRRAYEQEISKGAFLMNVVGGHTLEYISYCFGKLSEISATVATRVNQLRMADTGEFVATDTPDNVLVNGVLESGALVSYHISSVPFASAGWRMAAYGSKGAIVASTSILPQISPITLMGSQGDNPLAQMAVPERLQPSPSLPAGPPRNVGQLYMRMADAIHTGSSFSPNFDDALALHTLLDTIQRSSDAGRSIRIT